MSNPFHGVQISTCRGFERRVELTKPFLASLASEAGVLAVGAHLIEWLRGELPTPPVYRGRKHPARGLATYVDGRSGLQEIEAPEYKHPGQTTRGLRRMLCRLRELSLPAMWLVVLAQDVFETICQRAADGRPAGVPGPGSGGLKGVQRRLRKFKNEYVPPELLEEIVGDSDEIDLLRRQTARASRMHCNVIIRGETGTGKELVARAVHRIDRGEDKPFIARNCAAIPKALLESILFGYKKGSFSGATEDHPGVFVSANGGTVFLDEVGELSKTMQVKMLRVLDYGLIAPIGGVEELQTDVRLVCATSRELESMMERGELRPEFYARLTKMIPIQTPSLRSRMQDLPALVGHLWKRDGGTSPSEFSSEVMEPLLNYDWPRNVRQLEGFLNALRFECDEQAPDREAVQSLMEELGYL